MEGEKPTGLEAAQRAATRAQGVALGVACALALWGLILVVGGIAWDLAGQVGSGLAAGGE